MSINRCPILPAIGMHGLVLMLATASAVAVEFNQVQPAMSSVTFAYKQMGVGMSGGFRKFDAQVVFDPARVTAASASISIDLASVDAGSSEANDAVLSRDWFNAKANPKAAFVSSSVRALGGNRYEALGKLSIKGRSHDIAVPFTFSQAGGAGVFDGQFTIKRLDYAIGEGAWADVGTVANEIQIRFHVLAGNPPARK